jgi:predicted dehydrogenase
MAETARRIRLGMVGGGQGAFIGAVHRMAARLDDQYELVAGALSSRREVAIASAAALGLAADRTYADFAEMARAEAARPDGIEAVAIVTPNDLHFAPAKAFLEAGIHVICDKPMTATLGEARALMSIRASRDAKFLLTHNYSGYPLVRQARELVRSGALGTLRLVQAEYAQDWLTTPLEREPGATGAQWRTDPSRAGAGGAIGDIGTHAYHLMRFVSGLETEALSAELTSFVPGRQLDDNVAILLRLAGGARGMLWASQVAVGNENGLRLRVYGDRAGLDWSQEDPNRLWFTRLGEPRQLFTRGGPVAGKPAPAMGLRVPSGHPEGYIEAFATLYTQFAAVIRGEGDVEAGLLPGIAEGVEGMEFITAAIASSGNDGRWTKLGQE